MTPQRARLDQKIRKIDELLAKLEVRQINPLRVLAASVVAHDKRHRPRKVGRSST